MVIPSRSLTLVYWNNIAGTYVFNYACLQFPANNNAYTAKQLYYQKLQLKNIWNLFVLDILILMM